MARRPEGQGCGGSPPNEGIERLDDAAWSASDSSALWMFRWARDSLPAVRARFAAAEAKNPNIQSADESDALQAVTPFFPKIGAESDFLRWAGEAAADAARHWIAPELSGLRASQ